MPLAGAVDSFMLVNLMSDYLPITQARISFGVYTGLVLTLINVPTAGHGHGYEFGACHHMPPMSAGTMTPWRMMPMPACAWRRSSAFLGHRHGLLAEPIFFAVWPQRQVYAAGFGMGAQLLQISSLTIILFTHVQATSGICRGCTDSASP